MADVARHLSLGGMGAPDVAGVRQLLLQIEEHEHALSSSAFVGALEGAEPAAVAQARVRAQDDFARLKLNLLEQETKKRLLEQLLSNGGVGQSAEIVARAEAQMVEREAAAKAARAESVEIRERLVEHTCAIADAKRVLAREGSALLALVSSGESGTQRAVDAKALLLEREQALERLCLRRVAEEKAAELAASELAQLQAQLERKQAKLAQLGAQVQAARDEVAQAEIKLQSTLEQQAHSSKATADAVWHQHVVDAVGALGGVRVVAWEDGCARDGCADGSTVLTLELSAPRVANGAPPAHADAHELKVGFDAEGKLNDLVELSPSSVPCSDLHAAAARAAAFPLLVRELLARLTTGLVGAVEPAPRELPTRKRARTTDAAAADAAGAAAAAMAADAVADDDDDDEAVVMRPACQPRLAEPTHAAAQPKPPAAPAAPPQPQPSAATPVSARAPAPPPAAPSPAAPAQSPVAQAAPGTARAVVTASPASVARAAADVIDTVLPPAVAASPARAPAPAASDARAPPLILTIGQPTTDALEEAAQPSRSAPGSRRKSTSRKSFSRKSLDPLELKRILGISHSPCGRAEKAAAAADPKAAILGLQAEAAEVLLSLFTTEGALHARVLTDGSVLDREGRVLAFVEADGSVGSAAMDYVGEVNAATGWISDADETPIAMLDQGRVSVKDTRGSTIAEFDSAGCVKGHRGMACGRIEGFTYAHMVVAAALVTLVCPEFVRGF